ncbi:MAG: DUF2190 family protein [Desulfovibrionaceae bacterium]
MVALHDNRNTVERHGYDFAFTVAPGARVYQGSLVSLDSTGKAVSASISGKACVGVAHQYTEGGGIVLVRRGIFAFANSAGAEALSNADVGAVCYVADDQSVKKTAGTNPVAPIAGLVMAVDEHGVWLKI